MVEQSFIDVLHIWDSAVNEYVAKEWQKSISKFSQITSKSSRHLYNIACCEIQMKRYKNAIETLNSALMKDSHLVIAIVQRALCYYHINWHTAAVSDFEKALSLIGERNYISYYPMGLAHKLTNIEVMYNLGAVYAASHDFTNAEDWLVKARLTKWKHKYVEEALDTVRHRKTFPPLDIATTAIFHPDRSMLASVAKKDYLGRSKVLAEVKVTTTKVTEVKDDSVLKSTRLGVPQLDHRRSRSRDDVLRVRNDVTKPTNDVTRNESQRSVQMSQKALQQLHHEMPTAPPPRLVPRNSNSGNSEAESDVRNYQLPPPPKHPSRLKEFQRSQEVRPFESLASEKVTLEDDKFGKHVGNLKIDNDPWRRIDKPQYSELENALKKHRAKTGERDE